MRIAAAGAAAAFGSNAAYGAVYTAPSNVMGGEVIVLEPLTFVKIDDLSFGAFVVPQVGSDTVSVDAATGTINVGGSLIQLPQYVPERGHFMGAGTADQAVSVTAVLPDKLYLGGDTASPTWINVSLELDKTPDAGGIHAYTITSDRVLDVYVGGDLTISAGMAPGVYSAEYQLTATYE